LCGKLYSERFRAAYVKFNNLYLIDSEVVEKFPNLRSSITEKLLETFMDVKSGKVFRGALWIVGEYCSTCKGK